MPSSKKFLHCLLTQLLPLPPAGEVKLQKDLIFDSSVKTKTYSFSFVLVYFSLPELEFIKKHKYFVMTFYFKLKCKSLKPSSHYPTGKKTNPTPTQ